MNTPSKAKACMAGNAAACEQLLRAHGLLHYVTAVWDVRAKPGGALRLPRKAAQGNPLLAVLFARFQEGARLLHGLGEPEQTCVHVLKRFLCTRSTQWQCFGEVSSAASGTFRVAVCLPKLHVLIAGSLAFQIPGHAAQACWGHGACLQLPACLTPGKPFRVRDARRAGRLRRPGLPDGAPARPPAALW